MTRDGDLKRVVRQRMARTGGPTRSPEPRSFGGRRQVGAGLAGPQSMPSPLTHRGPRSHL